MDYSFPEGNWALILGGSSGFGLAAAHKLASHGMNICIVHRDRRGAMSRIQPEFDALKKLGGTVLTFNADALSGEKRDEIVTELASAMGSGRVRVLLHSIAFGNLKLIAPEKQRAHANAGQDVRGLLAAKLGVDPDKLREVADELFGEGADELIGVASAPEYPTRSFLDGDDLGRTIYAMGTSLLDWTQALLNRELFTEDARVFGLTSEGNTVAWKGYAAVATAKVALESVARAIAMELAPYGVRCNVIQAGVTETPALAAIPGSAQLKANARLRNPFGRLTTPRDVASALFLLCLDDAGWINGEVIRVDGGEHISGATQ